LLACLTALADDVPANTEVIVVSDGGDQAIFPDLSGFEAKLNLTVIHAEHGGPAHARNIGLRAAKGPVVAFIDDDCVPHPGWLERLTEAVSLDPPVAAGGTTLNGLPGDLYAETAQLILDVGERDQRQRRYEPVFYPSNNIAFPLAPLVAIGGFDPTFKTAEDRELCRRWLRAGYRLVKAADAVIEHSPRMNLRGFWRKYVTYGSGAAQFHGGPGEQWLHNSLGFHIRIPKLAAAQMSQSNIKRRVAIYAMLLVWEAASTTGYLQQKWNNRKKN
jgi:GT2 family glycosyltransferase